MPNWAFVTRFHRALYQRTGGRLGARLMGLDMLLLTTRGRRTGSLRTLPLACFPRDEGIVVVASNDGQDHDPAWWLNLQTDPLARVQLRGEQFPVRARQALGEERAALWPWLVERNPMYGRYAQRTSREIPVVVLEREAG